jgi:2-haloacid dehalogenase
LVIKYVTMDCYGTLIDWKKGVEANFEKYFLTASKQLGINGSSIFESYVRLEAEREKNENFVSYRDVMRETSMALGEYLRTTPENPREASEKFSKSIESWDAFSDTRETLAIFGTMGLRRYILSNIDSDILKKTIENNRLEVEGFITAEDTRSYKPAHNHWVEFLKRTDAGKDEVVHVANSLYHDIAPAGEMGFLTIWVNRYRDQNDTQIRAKYTVNSLSDIPELVIREKLV